jgi:hypothetical protein
LKELEEVLFNYCGMTLRMERTGLPLAKRAAVLSAGFVEWQCAVSTPMPIGK